MIAEKGVGIQTLLKYNIISLSLLKMNASYFSTEFESLKRHPSPLHGCKSEGKEM